MSKNHKNTNERVPGFSFVNKKKNITEYLLNKNGLTILFVKVAGSPAITSGIVYHVGSQNEGKGETGLAHMLEHMLFKPTKGSALTWKELEEKGAVLNANTWLDRTMYYFSLPKKYIGDMLEVEAHRMRNVQIVDKEFIPERTNVLSEYEMYNSRPESALEWNMTSVAFGLHGYKHDTIGFRGDIEMYTTAKLNKFYDRYYWPDNATLMIIGDVDEMSVLQQVKKFFGNIKRPGSRQEQVPTTPEPPQEGVRRVTLQRNTPIRNINLAFKAPSYTEKDWIILLLALSYLTEGKTSVLYQRLVDTKLATSVQGLLYPSKDPFLSFITIHATEEASYTKIEQIVFSELFQLQQSKISKSKLSELKQSLHTAELFERDGTLSIASVLTEYISASTWQCYFDIFDDIKTITQNDIQQVAKKYFLQKKATIGTIEKI